MSDTHEFRVTIGTGDSIDRNDAAELLQWAVNGANKNHDNINYITVQHSEMSAAEKGQFLDLLERFNSDDINSALESLDGLQDNG